MNVTDNFVALGGDSIKSIQIVAKVREAGYDIKVKDIFISQNIELLALKLKRINTHFNQDPVTGIGDLAPIQHWFYDYVKVEKAHYNQSVMLHFEDGIHRDLIAGIFEKLLEHHDALRLVFRVEAGSVVPEYKEPGIQARIKEVDLTGVADFEHQILSEANQIQSDIDLENGPLVSLGLFHREKKSFLLIVIHHLVVDGISWRILFEDIENLYQQALKGEVFRLPLKTDSYQSWTTTLKNYLVTKEFADARSYWNHQLLQEAEGLSRDWEVSTNKVEDQNTVQFRISKEETAQLLGRVH